MKMEKFDSFTEVPVPVDVQRKQLEFVRAQRSGGLAAGLIGMLFLIAAIPYWCVRILAGMVWMDVRRLGRLLSLCGNTYREALHRVP